MITSTAHMHADGSLSPLAREAVREWSDARDRCELSYRALRRSERALAYYGAQTEYEPAAASPEALRRDVTRERAAWGEARQAEREKRRDLLAMAPVFGVIPVPEWCDK